jgi:hypothetical protein
VKVIIVVTVTVTQVAAAPASATMGGWKAETHHAYMPALVTTETGDGGHQRIIFAR